MDREGGAELADGGERHVRGAPDAPVTVVEYGDFECPYCAAAAPLLRDLVDASEGRVRLVFRHFPLFEIHPHALAAALAAESATDEQVFWALHDRLFSHQDSLGGKDLLLHAKAVGADPGAVVGERAQAFAPLVRADYDEGVRAGVRGTPALFVAGTAYSGRLEAEDLRRATGLAPVGSGRRRRWSPGQRR